MIRTIILLLKNSVITGAVMSSLPSDGRCHIVSSVLENEA